MHKKDMLLSIDRFCTFLAVDTYLQAGESNNGDVVYEDSDVCVLRPDSKRGIIIYHEFRESAKKSIDRQGLRVKPLRSIAVREVDDPYILFRAPGAGCNECGPNPTVNDINRNYAPAYQISENDLGLYFCIRVDPSKTFVLSSQSRARYPGYHAFNWWNFSRSTLQNFLEVIQKNSDIESDKYNIFSYKKVGPAWNGKEITTFPPESYAEILVKSSIPPEWRVTIR